MQALSLVNLSPIGDWRIMKVFVQQLDTTVLQVSVVRMNRIDLCKDSRTLVESFDWESLNDYFAQTIAKNSGVYI